MGRRAALSGCLSPQFLCTVIAILLHYMYMSTFAWTFVESLHIYRVLTEARNIDAGPMRFYYVVGWGIPAIVTGEDVQGSPAGGPGWGPTTTRRARMALLMQEATSDKPAPRGAGGGALWPPLGHSAEEGHVHPHLLARVLSSVRDASPVRCELLETWAQARSGFTCGISQTNTPLSARFVDRWVNDG